MSTTISKITASVGFLLLIVSLTHASVPLTCISCNGIECLRTSLVKKETCLDPLDICVTVFNGFEVVRKGCSLQVPIELRKKCDKPNGIECHKCNENNCNSWGREDYRCVVCDSSRTADCRNNPSSIAPTRCASPTSPNSYCYVLIEGGKTTRGCSTSVKHQKDCLGSANCMLCLAGDLKACNTVNFTPGSARAFII